MAFVLDASVTIAWAYRDAMTPAVKAILERLDSEEAYVPALWMWEVANALGIGMRRNRIDEKTVQDFFALLLSLPVKTMPPVADIAFFATFAFAAKHNLTVYDASYLELADRRHIPLATQDQALIIAARDMGVEVI